MEIKNCKSEAVAAISVNQDFSREDLYKLESFFESLPLSKVRVVVLKVAGDNFIDVGTDRNPISNKLSSIAYNIFHSPIPVITSVNGKLSPEGLEIINASHISLASTDSTFRTAASPREHLSPQEALSGGFLNRIVPANVLELETDLLVERILELAPLAIKACLNAVNKGTDKSLEDGLALETKLFTKIFSTDDMREGTSAFLEKRKPEFQSK